MASPNLISGDVLLSVIKGRLYGQITETTFYWGITTAAGGYNLTTFVQDVITDVLPDFLDIVSSDWTTVSVYGRRMFPNPTRGQETAVGSTPGTVGATALPPHVAAVLSRYTNAPGPRGRGRVFIPAVPETFHTEGLVNAVGKAAYDAFVPWLDLPWTAPSTSQLEPVLFRRPVTAVNIESAKTQIVLRSQRRREVGVGI